MPFTATGYLYFDTIATAIDMTGSQFLFGTGTNIVHTGVTTEIKTGETDTATFAQIAAEENISNAAMGSSITYMNPSTYAITSKDEFDNTISGLTATTYKDAIDEVSSGATRNIVNVVNNS